jgi:adenylate cyclase
MSNTEQRKLAAIMFTDMVGYSALSQRDDKLALELLEEHRQLLREIFPRFNGTEIKTIGDAFLIEFQSALEAAQCAIEIQRTLAKRNHDVSAERRIELKIGLHIGDVVHRGGDVYGDGVNIASRIEALAGAGGICVSMDVERQIRNALEARFEKLAPTELKNISVAMDLFRIVLPWEQPSISRREEARTSKSEIRNPKSEIGKSPVTSAVTKWIGIAALMLLAIGLVWWFAHQSSKQVVSSPSVSTSRVPPGTAPTADQKSIAVLPFVNMSADKNDEYLSDGMTEELINMLSKVPGLRVPGRTSCFAFKGKNEEDIFRKVGDQLHVGTVLEGSVRKAGDKLRVTAQLINVSDGYHLWSKDYDGDVKDILNFQSNVAEQVVQALQVKLGGEGTRLLAKKPTENPEAHRLYLLGRYEFAKYTQTGWNNAIRYYEQALRIDPEFALAYWGLADNYAYMGSVVMPEKEAIAKEKEFAQKALELDPELAEAHMSLALALVAAYDWRNGLKEFDRALELNPNLAFAYELQSWTLNGLGRFDEAIAKTKKAIELDPLNPFFQMSLSFDQYWARQYDDAIAQARKTLAMDPNSAISHVLLGLSFLKKGDTAGAIAELQKSKAPDPGAWYQGFLGYAYAISGERAKAEVVLRELEQLAKRQYVSPTAFATIYLGLGQKEKCLDWLEKSYEQQDSACWYLKIDQIYDSVRNEPRFQALVQKVFGSNL